MNRWHLNQAVRVIRQGGVIAYPTEAVFGLGCKPEALSAVIRILAMKRRSIDKGLILIAADIDQLFPYVTYPDNDIRQQVINTWPGPVTWLLPAKPSVPFWIRGKYWTVAVRVSAHPSASALCRLTGGVLVSTSANPADYPPARTTRKVLQYFGQRVDYILPGKLGLQSSPTEIRDANTGAIIRHGS